MYVYLYIYINIIYRNAIQGQGVSPEQLLNGLVVRDFRDKVCPFFESDTLFLEWLCCVVFSRFAILRIEGCLNSALQQTIFLESPRWAAARLAAPPGP